MSGPPNNADADREGFTCSTLLMCLYPTGRSSKKKPEEEEATTSTPQAEAEPAPAPDHKPAEEKQEPPQVPGRAASFDKFECASLYSGNNIFFDFVKEGGDRAAADPGAPPHHGWCPSPCFDLPMELIRAGERYGSVAAACDTPVTAAFVFADCQGAALKKMASCLASGVEGRAPHLVRFLSESGSGAPRSPGTPSRDAPPKATAVEADHCEFADDGARAQRRTGGFTEQETVV